MKYRDGKRELLSTEEIRRIENLNLVGENEHLDKVRDSFLFAVYTGLRHCDMLELKWENVEEGKITLTMIKTGEEIAILG